ASREVPAGRVPRRTVFAGSPDSAHLGSPCRSVMTALVAAPSASVCAGGSRGTPHAPPGRVGLAANLPFLQQEFLVANLSFGGPPRDTPRRLRPHRRRRQAERPPRRLRLEALEERCLLVGSWAPVANLAPDAIGTMMLLTDGTVLAQDSSFSSAAARNRWFKLTPNASGSYANGTWSELAPMGLQRLYYGSNVLGDGSVFVIGGEYSGPNGAQNFTNTATVYDPYRNIWFNYPNFPESQFGDDPTMVLPNGNILGGHLSSPRTHIFDPYQT